MAQGEFTKEEADETIEAIGEIAQSLSKKKKLEFFSHFNDIGLFIEAAKRAAPTEADVKAEAERGLKRDSRYER
jgi:hypothetical protein